MRCNQCKAVIKGTEKYKPRKEGFERVYWNEFVELQVHEMKHCGYENYSQKNVIKYYSKLKKFLDKHKDMYGMTGESYSFSRYYDKFNASWRGFGVIMAAYMNTKIGKRKYSYVDFYM